MSRELHPNHLKYIKAPTIQMIDKVMDAYGVEEKQFERFFGIYKYCIKHVRNNFRPFPVQHWHIIYECLKLIEEGKDLPLYRQDIPKAPESSLVQKIFKSFSSSKKKSTPKRKTIKRTGSLCELC